MASIISRRSFLGTAGGSGADPPHPSSGACGVSGTGCPHHRPIQRGRRQRHLGAPARHADPEPIFGKPVTVENRAGGGGWVGWGSLAQSQAGRLHYRLTSRPEHIRRLPRQAVGGNAQGKYWKASRR